MIEVHAFSTPNSVKVPVALEEMGIAYELKPVNVRKGEQLFFHASGVGPAFGQSGFFQKQAAEQVPFAIARFSTEANRVMTVLNGVLATSKFTAGDEYTIADIAHFGWLWRSEFAGIDLNEFLHVRRWYDAVVARPAVARALERVAVLVPQA